MGSISNRGNEFVLFSRSCNKTRRRRVPLLEMQCFENQAECRERTALTIGFFFSLCKIPNTSKASQLTKPSKTCKEFFTPAKRKGSKGCLKFGQYALYQHASVDIIYGLLQDPLSTQTNSMTQPSSQTQIQQQLALPLKGLHFLISRYTPP